MLPFERSLFSSSDEDFSCFFSRLSALVSPSTILQVWAWITSLFFSGTSLRDIGSPRWDDPLGRRKLLSKCSRTLSLGQEQREVGLTGSAFSQFILWFWRLPGIGRPFLNILMCWCDCGVFLWRDAEVLKSVTRVNQLKDLGRALPLRNLLHLNILFF